ncbi:hypothetical protein DEV91_12611 [Phyllobacterium brassicacearum]|nr:hypothetical protein DEV91_12611 [Phyllobacterium brassicacearum]
MVEAGRVRLQPGSTLTISTRPEVLAAFPSATTKLSIAAKLAPILYRGIYTPNDQTNRGSRDGGELQFADRNNFVCSRHFVFGVLA